MIDLTPIKTRLAAATPGPWLLPASKHNVGGEVSFIDSDANEESLLTIWGGAPTVNKLADAEFIAASRADVESLVAEVERLRSRFSMANAKPLKFEPFPGEFEDDGA
jgi:hypothetical protein